MAQWKFEFGLWELFKIQFFHKFKEHRRVLTLIFFFALLASLLNNVSGVKCQN